MAHFENILQIKRYPKAALLTLGTELLTGAVLNTNAAYLGRELTQLGFEVHWQSACRDEKRSIQEALRRALDRSDVVLVSGGLGPTPDDITRESLAEFFNVPLVLSKIQYQMILGHYRRRGKVLPSAVKQEACLPANAKPIFNHFGIALGFTIEKEGQVVIVLPGVPGELTRLFETRLKPFLRKKFPDLHPARSLIVKTVGLSEPSIMKYLGRSFFKMGKFDFGIYPEYGEVALRIYADSSELIRRLKARIVRVIGDYVYSFSDESLEKAIGTLLLAKRWTLAIAESCTGGKVADRVVAMPGASRYFKGGIVAYRDEAKVKILGVSFRLIREKGAVSRETVIAMAQRVRERFGSTLGLAVTGIAGPTGGTVKKPAGLVYLALASPTRQRVWKQIFYGTRQQVQARAVKKALEYLWREIRPL